MENFKINILFEERPDMSIMTLGAHIMQFI